MNYMKIFIPTGATAVMLVSGFMLTPPGVADPSANGPGRIVVANRMSGTVSVIDAKTDTVATTLDLPPDMNPAEPMYVWYSPIRSRFFVGDRANDRVVAFDANTLEVEAVAATGAGVFHMWGSVTAKQLWVNNDIDNTSTVLDLRTLDTLATVPTPADLVGDGGKPHDVILSPDGEFAYVTVLGLPGDADYVVQFDTETFMEIGRAAVGKDPHVSLTRRNELLYVPCQNTNNVYVLDRITMETVEILDVPGAHGAGMPVNGRFFYTTNITGGGPDAIWTIDTGTNEVIGEVVGAPYATPHNIALTPTGKLYLTHSGANTMVTIYHIKGNDPVPSFLGEVTVEENPFGLAYVP